MLAGRLRGVLRVGCFTGNINRGGPRSTGSPGIPAGRNRLAGASIPGFCGDQNAFTRAIPRGERVANQPLAIPEVFRLAGSRTAGQIIRPRRVQIPDTFIKRRMDCLNGGLTIRTPLDRERHRPHTNARNLESCKPPVAYAAQITANIRVTLTLRVTHAVHRTQIASIARIAPIIHLAHSPHLAVLPLFPRRLQAPPPSAARCLPAPRHSAAVRSAPLRRSGNHRVQSSGSACPAPASRQSGS